jgi:hypothetical protein
MKSAYTTRRPLQQQATSEQKGPFFIHAQQDSKKKQDAFFQTKLAIGDAGGKHEKEADDVAGKVQKKEEEKKEPAAQRMVKEEKEPVQKMEAGNKDDNDIKVAKKEEEKKEPAIQKMSDSDIKEDKKVQEKESSAPDGEEKLQMKDNGGAHATHKMSVEERIKQSKGKGLPLPQEVRQSMEGDLGIDLSSVRIHTDNEAAAMNKDLQALAFTNGADIYFNTNQYSPGSAAGKKLLAHELTHVVQQTGPPKKEKKH